MSTNYPRREMIHNPYLRKSTVNRVKQGRPHTNEVIDCINSLDEVAKRLVAFNQKIEADQNLSAAGRESKLNESVRGDLAKQYARVSRAARVAPASIESEKKGLGLPAIDKTDIAGTMRRLELRTFLRDLPPEERYARAHEFAKDPDLAVALFEMPPPVCGLDDESLKMPAAKVFEKLRDDVIGRLHGPRLAELNEKAADYAEAAGMAGVIRRQLYEASGLSQKSFDDMMRHLEAEADGPPPVSRPASVTSSSSSFEFDREAFSADFDRVWNEGMAKALADTRAEINKASGGN